MDRGGTHLLRVASLVVAVALVLADSSIAVLALPAIYGELDVELGDVHWVLTSFNLALALAALPAALAARRAAATTLFPLGLLAFAAASAACAAAPGFGSLVGFRAVQALGGALVAVAALELLGALVSERRRAVAIWVAAGAAGAALGPALGGVLTETISWRAVFAVQAPVALLPLPFVLGLRLPPRPAARAALPRISPNLGLVLISAGLAAALFLVVLLLIEGRGLSPVAAAAVVSALPLAAIATAPVARRVESTRARGAAGALLVAGGLAALGLLPGADWAWTLAPQLLVGAGLALAFAGLTEAALEGREPLALHGAATVAARHAGIVLGLLVLSPLLVADLEEQRLAAERAGAARLLDSDVSPATKVRLARALLVRLGEPSSGIPDLAPAFESIRPERGERPALARLRRGLDDVVDRAVTTSFSRAFLVAAGLSLAALLAAAVAPRRPA